MGIPPISAPGVFGGQPTCPQGYYYDPGTQLCQPIPGNATTTPISVTAWGLSDNEVDPVQAAINTGVGWSKSGFIGQFVAALWHALMLAVDDGVSLYFNAYDRIIAYIASEVQVAVTRNNPGLWIAIGSLLSDLLGINLDGSVLYTQLATRGTLPAMQAVGGSLIDLLIGEFTGTATGTGGSISYSSNPDAATGLPPGTLTPLQGLNGAKALMGFVLTSAVRQANIDGLVDAIPFGMGAAFEKYSEGVRTNLGIGRMMRFALKPIFKVLIADQMARGINMAYVPTLFSAEEAIRAYNNGDYTTQELAQEMLYHGYNNQRAFALAKQKQKNPAVGDLRTLWATGSIADLDRRSWLHNESYTDTAIATMDLADDIRPARAAVLVEVSLMAHKYMSGSLPADQFQAFVNNVAKNASGQQYLTPGEVLGLLSLPSMAGTGAKLLHLPFFTLTTMYEEGVITLQDFESEMQARGYSSDQVSELTLMLLIKAKKFAEQSALLAAKAAVAATTASGKGETAVATAETNLSQQTGVPGLPPL